jgi:hypothetical protein
MVMFMLLAGFLCFSFLVFAARTREYIAALLHSVCATAWIQIQAGRPARRDSLGSPAQRTPDVSFHAQLHVSFFLDLIY